MGIQDRRRGWLTEPHHLAFREILLHTLTRQHLLCPAYCVMPDHAHFLFGGCKVGSDQRVAVKFLRRHWNDLLKAAGEYTLQVQPYDHVLNDRERSPDSFMTTVGYLIENPVRSQLVECPKDWPFLGAMIPGYPTLSPLDERFFEIFWKVYYEKLDSPKD